MNLLKRPLIFLKLVIIIPYITVNFSYLDVIIVRLSDISDLFTFTRKDPSYSLLSPVAILVIDRSLHAQKPRQDVDKHPVKRRESDRVSQSEARASVLWPMRVPTCVSRVSLCGSPGSGSEYWAPPPSLLCCNIKIIRQSIRTEALENYREWDGWSEGQTNRVCL